MERTYNKRGIVQKNPIGHRNYSKTTYEGHCWRADNELASTALLLQPQYGQRSRGRPAKTYIGQLVEDTEYTLDELPNAMNDRDGWRKHVNECRASSTC